MPREQQRCRRQEIRPYWSRSMSVLVQDAAEYVAGTGLWDVPGDVALPCATQNELQEGDCGCRILHPPWSGVGCLVAVS